MNTKTFAVDYKIIFRTKESDIKSMRIKECMSECHAKLRIDKYIKKKYDDVLRVVVVSCEETEEKVSWLKDMFGFNVVR